MMRGLFAGAMAALLAFQAPHTTRFVVLGHLRGGRADRLNPKLGEVLRQVKALHPDFAVLTGDIIWGDVEGRPPHRQTIEDEWNAVDSALATLGIPVYRTPGNHDISDVQSRDIWIRRYGAPPPKVITVQGTRLILLSSAFIPPDGDTTHMKYIGGVDLDTAQTGFLRRTLADTSFAHTFVFMHHLLWWEPDSGRWWRDVHPLLARGRVDDVFSGDYGPMKFSTKAKDGLRYYQGSIELRPPLSRLQTVENTRLLSSQFDVFFEVQVNGDSSKVIVHPVNETAGDFSPEHWKELDSPPPPTMQQRWRQLRQNRARLLLVCGLAVGTLAVGLAAGWFVRGRRA